VLVMMTLGWKRGFEKLSMMIIILTISLAVHLVPALTIFKPHIYLYMKYMCVLWCDVPSAVMWP